MGAEARRVTWARIDDALPQHPKLLSAGPLARDLFVSALCHCNRYLTDGWISLEELRALGRYEGIFFDSPNTLPGILEPVSVDVVIASLVANGLLEVHGGRYFVHDYPEYQPSRSEVEEQRALWREKKKRQRGEANGEAGEFIECVTCGLKFKTRARHFEHMENVHGRVSA